MAMTEAELEPQPPVGGVTIVYTGPTAPHWDFRFHYGDRTMNEDFRARAMARLLLLPPHDPQFRRNRERVIRDAERENIELTWDLGLPDESTTTPAAPAAEEQVEAPAEEAPAEEAAEDQVAEVPGDDATEAPADEATEAATDDADDAGTSESAATVEDATDA